MSDISVEEPCRSLSNSYQRFEGEYIEALMIRIGFKA